MGTITLPNTFVGGTTALASEVNANFDAIINEVNGGLSSVNLANGAVTENKLADGAVATAKIEDLAVTLAKIANGTITDAKIAAGAAIALSKLAAVTADRALVSDGTGEVTTSAVTATELGYLDGVTSAIQTQLDALVPQTRTVATGSVLEGGGDLTANRTLDVTDGGVTPVKTSFFDSAESDSEIYFGRIDIGNAAIRLPSGWSADADYTGGTALITHNLGHQNYIVIATPIMGGFSENEAYSFSESLSNNTFQLSSWSDQDDTWVDREVCFIVITY